MFHFPFNPLEEISTVLYVASIPELLINLECTQTLRLRIFEPALLKINLSLQIDRASKVVCIIDRVQLGLLDLNVCVVKPAFITKQPR